MKLSCSSKLREARAADSPHFQPCVNSFSTLSLFSKSGFLSFQACEVYLDSIKFTKVSSSYVQINFPDNISKSLIFLSEEKTAKTVSELLILHASGIWSAISKKSVSEINSNFKEVGYS